MTPTLALKFHFARPTTRTPALETVFNRLALECNRAGRAPFSDRARFLTMESADE